MMMKCVDLFSGCGGFSLGFQKAGIDVVAAIDNWYEAKRVYEENFSHKCYLHDLSDESGTLKIIQRYSPDIIIGGPPCQDFSSAGKRDESLGRANLTHSFSNVVCSYKPKFFVMENVERIKKSKILSDILYKFNSCGYALTDAVLDASYCGVPQSRKRFFLIGKLEDFDGFLDSIFLKNMQKTPMTVRDYLGESLGIEAYYRHPRNYSRRGIFTIDEPSPTIRGVNRPVPKGYNKHNLDPKHIDLEKVRPLSTIERSYIQTFPNAFKFKGTKSNLEQMIGNAVPVNLAKFVAESLLEYVNDCHIS